MIYNHKNGASLRKVGREDLPTLHLMKNDGWTTQHKTSIINDEDQIIFFESLQKDKNSFYFMVEDRTEKLTIGCVNVSSIDWISRTAYVGMMACQAVKGSPHTKKLPEIITDFAFEVLNLRKLEAEVLSNNPAALKFDLNLGYQIEGTKIKSVYKCGQYLDSVMIAMFRDDWQKSERVKSYEGVCCKDYKGHSIDSIKVDGKN